MKNMTTILAVVLGMIVSASIYGCRNGESGKDKMNTAVLENEVNQLTSQVADLNRKLDALGAERKTSSDSCTEIKEWADMVVKDLGKGIWYISDKRYPKFVEPFKTGGVPEIIEELNKKFRKDKLPEVLFLGREKDKVIVGVSDDAQLTQKMGSSGAASYMNAVVFTLASVEGVACVQFKFEEGDHAVPGTYYRSFLKSSSL